MKKPLQLDSDRMVDYTHSPIRMDTDVEDKTIQPNIQDRPEIFRGLSLSPAVESNNSTIPSLNSNSNTNPPPPPTPLPTTPVLQQGLEVLNPKYIYVEASGDIVPVDDCYIATTKSHFPDCQHYLNGVSIRHGMIVFCLSPQCGKVCLLIGDQTYHVGHSYQSTKLNQSCTIVAITYRPPLPPINGRLSATKSQPNIWVIKSLSKDLYSVPHAVKFSLFQSEWGRFITLFSQHAWKQHYSSWYNHVRIDEQKSHVKYNTRVNDIQRRKESKGLLLHQYLLHTHSHELSLSNMCA